MSQAHAQRDLWPQDIGVTSIVAPVAILREQANLLSEKTKGLLVGEVATHTQGVSLEDLSSRPKLVHNLRIRVPALDDYRYELLGVTHLLPLYPAEIIYFPTGERTIVSSEEGFLHILQQLLSRPETLKVINSLLAQVGQ